MLLSVCAGVKRARLVDLAQNIGDKHVGFCAAPEYSTGVKKNE